MTRPVLTAAATLAAVLFTAAPARAEWVWPVRGEVITYYRNGDDPYASGQHRGIDIAAEPGTRVVAAAGGEVSFAGTAGSSGLTVSVRTGDGRFDTSYLHLSSAAVSEGQRVAAGDTLGAVGTSGERSAERSHLHFGVRDAGSRHAYHDPLAFLPPSLVGPERPRPTPGPAPVPVTPGPAPVPVTPRPEPVRVSAPGGAPRSAPVPRGAPAPRRAPVPRTAPVPRGAPAPHPRPVPRRAPAPREAPHARPTLGLEDVRSPRAVPGPEAAARQRLAAGRRGPASPVPAGNRGRGHAAESLAGPGEKSATAPAPDRSPGPDLGWALACVGLLLAAAVLGLCEDGRHAARTGRGRVAGALRPLLGRR